MDKYVDQMRQHPLFAGVKDKDVKPMLTCMQGFVRTYKKGEYIILEEETVHHIGIIIVGKVDMIKEDFWGNKTILVRMKENELFGETFACSSNFTSVVTFQTTANTTVLFLPFHRVMHHCTLACNFHHRVIENMTSIIAAKNRQLMEKVEVISKKTLREKILAYLSQQAQLHQTKYVEIPLGRIELADYLCTDRSALTRELSKMRDDGLIDYDKNTFVLKK